MKRILSAIKIFFLPCSENRYRPKLLEGKILGNLLVFLLLLKLLTLPLIFSVSKTFYFAEITKAVLVELLNQERKLRGLPPLKENQKLETAAFLKAKDMLEKNYFAHRSPEGLSPWYWFKVAGYNFAFAGENLAIGFLDSKEVHQAWMESPLHRQNILNPKFQEIGIAVLKGEFNGNEVYVVVQHFGTPKLETKIATTTKPTTPSISQAPKAPQFQKETPLTQTTTLPQTTPQKEIAAEQPTNTKEEIVSTQTNTLEVLQKESSTSSQSLSFKFLKFLTTKYTFVLNIIIYTILLTLIFSLSLASLFDIFVYRKFVIDYKDIIPRLLGFTLLLLIFVSLDQPQLLRLIPHKLLIYGL